VAFIYLLQSLRNLGDQLRVINRHHVEMSTFYNDLYKISEYSGESNNTTALSSILRKIIFVFSIFLKQINKVWLSASVPMYVKMK
jgi:hypothetical protein